MSDRLVIFILVVAVVAFDFALHCFRMVRLKGLRKDMEKVKQELESIK